MHDFCFTPFLSALLLLGGLVGWAAANSVPSLVAGTGAAVISGLATYISLQTWIDKRKKCTPAVVVELAVTAAVAYKMYDRFIKALTDPEGHILQASLFVICVAMGCYYVWNLVFFRPKDPPPVKPMDINQLKKDAKAYKASKIQ